MMIASSFLPGGDAWQFSSGLLPVLLAAVLAVGGLAPSPAAAQDETVVSIQDQEAPSGAAVDVPIDVSGFTQVGSVSLIITYDPSALSFPDEAEDEDLISNAVKSDFTANVSSPGELRISWFDVTGSDPINLGEGILLEITFSEFAGDTTEVAFGPNSEISDADANPIGATFEDGTVSFSPNQAPEVGTNEGLMLDEGAAAPITTDVLSASDPDDGASDLTFDVTEGPSNGTLLVSDSEASSFTQADLEAGDVSYSHDGSETTEDSFTFALTDAGGAGPDPQTFEITVQPVEDPPTIGGLPEADTIEEDGTAGPIGFSVDDPETPPGDLAVTASSGNTDLVPGDSIELGGTGSDRTLTATPRADSNGTADITVTVENGGQQTASATLTLEVEPVNDAPVVRVLPDNDSLKTPGPPLQLINVVQTVFRDPEGDELTASSSSSDPSVVTVEVTGEGTLTVVPEGTGTAEVFLTASDGDKETSVSFMATVEQRPEGEPEPRAVATALVDTTGNGRTVDFGDTGMRVVPFGVEGTGLVRVAVFDSAPDSADGINEENVSQYRAVITAGAGLDIGSETEVRFPVSDFGGIDDPAQVTMYSRPSLGSGSFMALSTSVDEKGTPDDSSDDEIVGTTGSFSEFVLASNTEPLPVELVRFAAQLDGIGAILQWETAGETSNAGFTVQHQGPDQQGFAKLGFVESKATSGTIEKPQTYQFRAEELAPGTHQFRLRQVDLDGAVTLLDTTSVEVEASRELALEGIGANPVRQSTQFTFSVKQNGQASVVLYDVLGQQVKTLHAEAARAGQQYTVEVPAIDLASGVYFVRLEAPSGKRAKRIEVVR